LTSTKEGQGLFDGKLTDQGESLLIQKAFKGPSRKISDSKYRLPLSGVAGEAAFSAESIGPG